MEKTKEYDSIKKLEGIAERSIAIPKSIICANENHEKLVSVFSFFSVRRGLDSVVSFSINSIVEWLGKTPDHHANGINEKVKQAIDLIENKGYLLNKTKLHATSFEATFNLDQVTSECEHERFAIIYLDEKTVIRFHSENPPSKVFRLWRAFLV